MPLLNDLIYDTNVGKTVISLDRVRRTFHGSMRHLNSEGSSFEFGSEENFHWFTSGYDLPFFNQVTLYDSDPVLFEKALKRFYDLNTVHTVFLGGAGLAHAETLKARGYIMRSVTPLMAYALDPIIDMHTLRPGLEVKRVENLDDLKHAQNLLTSGFNLPEELVQNYTKALFGNPDSYRYNLLDNGVPVSTTHFIRTEKFLGCFDVTTPVEHQRKGYGDELMKWALAAHAAMGDELVVLQASTAGQPLYRQRGFQFLEFVQGWYMEETNRMRRFTHHNLQFDPYALRPLREIDSEWIIPYLNDPAITQWMGLPSPFASKDFEVLLKRWRDAQQNGLGINWVIEEDESPVAMIACHHTDWKFKRTEIGYMAFPPSRGKGIVPTVTRQLAEFVFNQYGMERIEIRAVADNEPSKRAAEKAGFTFEGRLRRDFLNLGEVVDDLIYSMIRSDLTG